MMNQKVERPTLEELDRELARQEKIKTYGRSTRGTVWLLIVVAAAAILCSTLLFSVYQVKGESMEPTLRQDQLIVASKIKDFHQGDIVAFYYGNKVLLKRVIAVAGDEVDIKPDGTVLVNDREIDEPYISGRSAGTSDVTFPLQVPDGRLFVLGDNREVSIDSRASTIGCVAVKSAIGKVILRIWPLSGFRIF